jgi:hypothetical protein
MQIATNSLPAGGRMESEPFSEMHGCERVLLLPDFLVISPPKTGSTWLADNVRCHPELFVPAKKEIKYFSSYCRWQNLDWYCEHFRAGSWRIKGEASPSYCLLPRGIIQWIRALMPSLKLIYLMREPIGRAWSHAKHTFRYNEANFQSVACDIDDVPAALWQENVAHEWTLASGDYLGQLRRWLSVFPREQVYVGFYESLSSDPQELLTSIFDFLNVETDVDFSRFPLFERLHEGPNKDMPHGLQPFMHSLLRERTANLVKFLNRRFGLELPQEWRNTLEAGTASADVLAQATEAGVRVFSREFHDDYLASVLDADTAVIERTSKDKQDSPATGVGHHGGRKLWASAHS